MEKILECKKRYIIKLGEGNDEATAEALVALCETYSTLDKKEREAADKELNAVRNPF
jgi:hypothetical protein